MTLFRGVVPRAQIARHTEGMSTALWLRLPVRQLPIARLIFTQPGVHFEGLLADGESYSGDPFAHVVDAAGEWFLEDGHHRAVRALLAGRLTLPARVLAVPLRCPYTA